jgi:hypothetical protein
MFILSKQPSIANQFLAEYKKQISYADLTGFSGCSVAEKLNVIELYVNGIE